MEDGGEIMLVLVIFVVGFIAYNEYQQVQTAKANAAILQAKLAAAQKPLDPTSQTIQDIGKAIGMAAPLVPLFLAL